MKHKLSTILALVILTIAIAAATARAQTTANGPYYAPPSWDQTLPVATRFIILSNFASDAVLDRETGLVWEKSPDTTPHDWEFVGRVCANKNVGGRKGWRLPSFVELASLVDPANSSPALPTGHPFINIPSLTNYWSATTLARDPTEAWAVRFGSSAVGNGPVGIAPKTNLFLGWCVRGAMNADQYGG
jgi:hypothetical protein